MSTIRTPWRFRLVVALLVPISLLLLSPLGATSSERLLESTTPATLPAEIGTAIRIQVGEAVPRVITGLHDNIPVVTAEPNLVDAQSVR